MTALDYRNRQQCTRTVICAHTHTHIHTTKKYTYIYARITTPTPTRIYTTQPNGLRALAHMQRALSYSIKGKVHTAFFAVVVVAFIHVRHSWILASTFFNTIRHIVTIFQKRPTHTHIYTTTPTHAYTMTNDQLLLLFLLYCCSPCLRSFLRASVGRQAIPFK